LAYLQKLGSSTLKGTVDLSTPVPVMMRHYLLLNLAAMSKAEVDKKPVSSESKVSQEF